jgi:lysine-N-methylase
MPAYADYAGNFRCIGSACEDTCCAGWAVNVDRLTYAKYGEMAASPLHILMQQRIQPNLTSKSDRDFAQMQLQPNGDCPFLSAERLCSIQIEHGAEALSPTCSEFPRSSRRIDGREETSLQLSCPEAARLVLLNRQFLRPKGHVGGQRERYRRLAVSAANLLPASGNPYQYFWELRRWILLLLGDRSYPLWQRLFILGMFCKRLPAFTPPAETVAPRGVPKLIQSYAEIMTHAQLRGSLDQIPARPEAQFFLVVQVLQLLSQLQPLPPRFLDCLSDCLKGIGAMHDAPDPDVHSTPSVARYIDATTRYYLPFFKKNEYMLENYLLSYVIRKRFPYGEEFSVTNPLAEFTLMALRFALVKGLLIGMAGHYRERFAAEHVVKLVQAFVRSVEHHPPTVAEMLKCIQKGNLENSEAIAMMLHT